MLDSDGDGQEHAALVRTRGASRQQPSRFNRASTEGGEPAIEANFTVVYSIARIRDLGGN